MPNHQENAPAHVISRVRRWAKMSMDARRTDWRLPVEPTHPSGPGPGTTTLDATLRPVGAGRYRRLGWTDGEPHLRRTDLGVDRDDGPVDGGGRRSLLYFGHHTDVHVCDAQSPARLESGDTYGWFNPGADGGHRPQETCTTQVLDQLVAATNAVTTSPVTGAPMAWCIQTGDNTDNRTEAEVAWWMAVLRGDELTPNTGAVGRYEGVQRSGWRGAWQPDDPSHDVYGRAGFPHLPGFLDAAVSGFQAVGLDVPWLAVFGNHDVLYQGTFGPKVTEFGDLLAACGTKPRGTLGLLRSDLHTRLAGSGHSRWERWGHGPGLQKVTADPDARRSVPLDRFLGRLIDDGDHGFGPEHLVDQRSWWSRTEGDQVQVIGLDSCNHTIGSGGSLGPRQTAWLEDELQRHHSRWVDPAGRWVDSANQDRLIVLFSHHNSWTMDNTHDDEADPGPRTLGDDLVALLTRYPNVVLWANGHSHEHKILVHPGAERGLGLWEVDTASGVDFGQQGRTFELLANDNGTVSILVTVLDHAAPAAVTHRTDGRWTVPELASISRELAVNDNRWIDPLRLLGQVEDRNVELVVAAPFPLAR